MTWVVFANPFFPGKNDPAKLFILLFLAGVTVMGGVATVTCFAGMRARRVLGPVFYASTLVAYTILGMRLFTAVGSKWSNVLLFGDVFCVLLACILLSLAGAVVEWKYYRRLKRVVPAHIEGD